MLRPTRPERAAIVEYLRRRCVDYTHPHEGATRGGPEATRGIVGSDYDVDHYRIRLGNGEATFARACDALGRWAHFDLGWVELCFPSAPLAVGEVVGVLARPLGLWSLNPCRIAYTVDESPDARRFGFAYGTLSGHVESGEERFLVEWQPRDDEVSYEILAFSRPASLAAQLGRVYARRLQRRFARDSMQRMCNEVSG